MNNKILVTYASRAGSTAEIAAAIGKALNQNGVEVEVRDMKDVKDLSAYHAVVAGSAVRGGKWLPEAMAFLKDHQSELAQKPFAAFLVCITMGHPNPQWRAGVKAWLAPVRTLTTPVSEGFFAGRLDFKLLPITLNTLMLRLAVALHILPAGDKRDWKAIDAWAESVRPLLQ
ncbi:MAG TPA: flavodoxin domain-containing protein [Anaerolineae bacterium]|jgi:menaquinone-dependent protoporphyrinogen oxidase